MGIQCHTSRAFVISILQGLEEKSRQMTLARLWPPSCLVNTLVLTSYDVNLEAQTCNCRRWQVSGIQCSRLIVLREKRAIKNLLR